LCCSHTGDHSQEDLAKFDYRSIQKETKSYRVITMNFRCLVVNVLHILNVTQNQFD
jgi:hypothetical protein